MPAPAATQVETLPHGLVDALAAPGAFGGETAEHVQTHISHVFLTRDRVYKLRKAVDLGFVSFATRAVRDRDCLREVALNRRLAPSVYLGVAPLLRDGAAWRVGPVGEDVTRAPEHCVVMRRLPTGGDALSRLRAGTLGDPHLDAVARCLAHFHGAHALGHPAPFTSGEWSRRIRAPIETNFRVLRELALPAVPVAWVDRVAAAARRRLDAASARLETRRREGRAADGHGDVHLEHVWFEGDSPEPLLIDCIEFDADLRCVDVASEVAFLAMDCTYRGRPDLAHRFLRTYAAESDDFGLYGVVDDYASYRAAVRAKVAALVAADPGIEAPRRAAAAASAARHLALAESYLAPRDSGALVLLCGPVGSGKSTVAAAVADAAAGVVISSDRTRKRLAGLAPTDRTAAAPDEGIYAPAMTDAVYAGLLSRAAHVVDAGRVAVLDATFAARARRSQARRWAAARGLRVLLVRTSCPPDVAAARLRARASAGHDPSDAGPGLLECSLRAFEPPDEWPPGALLAVDTAGDWRERLAAAVAARLS